MAKQEHDDGGRSSEGGLEAAAFGSSASKSADRAVRKSVHEPHAEDVARLYRQTEGWPAGLYLAALYLKEGGSLAEAAGSFGGADRFVSEYMESEFLARISR